MRACIVAVGSEMLTPFRLDTNSLVVTERLDAIGYDVVTKVVVGDVVADLVRTVRHALDWADLIVVIGGLGPTADDVTRESVAEALGLPLEFHEHVLDRIRNRFAKRGLRMPDINRRQAMAPQGAVLVDNANGTAPGVWLEHGRGRIVLLPGPPREMAPMLDAVIKDRLAPSSGFRLLRRVLKITGRTESDVDAHAEPVYSAWRSRPVPISTTILAVMGQIELHLTARAASREAADAALNAAVAELIGVLGDAVFSTDGRSLEAVVGELLRARRLTIAAAESCTGGLLTSRLTDVPGSSAYVERGFVCYSNRSKVDLLGVPDAMLKEHGAVSEPVALAMALGARARAGTDGGIGITGIAGPDGGSAEKPVGTVAIAAAMGDATRVGTFHLLGGREQVKFHATQAALNTLRLMLIA
jgi:nicotinamide-nucleotide amidase